MTYEVAILSYKRPDGVCSKSLKVLLAGGVPKENICVYLHEHDEFLEDYRDNLDLLGIRYVVTNAVGTKEQRARIFEQHPVGYHIVSMDDDVERLVMGMSPKDLVDVTDVHRMILESFEVTVAEGLFSWGLYTSTNPYFMKARYSVGLRPYTYCMIGIINRPGHTVHDLATEYCDDMEFCLRSWWWDGGIVRLDNVAVVQEYLSEGGLNAGGRDVAGIHQMALKLKGMWPDHVKMKDGAGGVTWIKPKTLGRKEPHPVSAPPPGIAALQELL